MRVRLDEVLLARIHGCVGPAFFAYCVALAVLTSRRWLAEEPPQFAPKARKLQRLALVTTALAYLQVVLGSALRHMPVWAAPADFRVAVMLHLAVAVALTAHVVLLVVRVLETARGQWALVRPAAALGMLLLVQLGLGLGTWLVKYGWPTWLGNNELNFVVRAEGPLQAYVATLHVAVGSLVLVTSLLVALRSLRLVRGRSGMSSQTGRPLELVV